MKLFFYALILFSLFSCNFLHYMGTSTPRNESEAEIESFLSKENLRYDFSYLLKDSMSHRLSEEKHVLNLYKLKTQTSASPIQLRIYDHQRNLVNGYAQCFGDFKKLNILATYPSQQFEHLPINYELKLEDEFELWDIPERDVTKLRNTLAESSYTYVIYWNIWSNYYSKIILKNLEKHRALFGDDRNTIILINTGVSIELDQK